MLCEHQGDHLVSVVRPPVCDEDTGVRYLPLCGRLDLASGALILPATLFDKDRGLVKVCNRRICNGPEDCNGSVEGKPVLSCRTPIFYFGGW